jgi:hypothetical protein
MGLTVNSNRFTSPRGEVVRSYPGKNQAVSSGVHKNIVEGIDAQVNYFFPDENTYVAALYTVTNTSEAAIDVTLAVDGVINAGADTTLQYTSSGDAALDDADEYFVVNNAVLGAEEVAPKDSTGDHPAILITRFGEGAAVKPTTELVEGALTQSYQFSVPAAGTRHVLVMLAMGRSISDVTQISEATYVEAKQQAVGVGGVLWDSNRLAEIVNYNFGEFTEESSSDDDGDDDDFFGALDIGFILGGLGGVLIRRRRS